MPMIVIHSKRPNPRCVRQIQKPPTNIQIMFMISDKDKNIVVNVAGGQLNAEFGEDMTADVIGKMSKETFDNIVQGRITFHRAFMTGDMTAKGNFRTLRMLDEIFDFGA